MKIFKKISLPLLFLAVFAACKSKNDANTRNIQLLSDSSAYNNNSTTDSIKMREKNSAEAGSGYRYHSKEPTTNQNVSEKTQSTSGAGTTSNNSTTTTQSTRKKGWSKAAQGAVIGGAAGAVGGAIISKHKGTGAAIGAVVGAAGGYIIGRNKDKKDGR
ncbi:MAG TPA: glycine zipper domain-containing protein [Hanamia sp.]|nr:glycine zipper domain-containing protein [Hanamia sp.]